MITQEILDKYETTIGLEIHVQLDTKSKMFCRCDNDSNPSVGRVAPNTNVCPICMGYPGTLPVMNEKAVEFGVRLAKSLGCEINNFQRFDRKNYFYPDLPKGYQISQFFFPVGEHGKITLDYLASDRKTKIEFTVGITRLHLEEDAGKLTHSADSSLVDLNRCGTPLAEIVSGPDFSSPEQAKAFMQELQRIVRVLGVSSADMEKGHMRVDGNISVRLRGTKELGSKVEVKNMNSFRFLEQALKFEEERQMTALEAGETIAQETRGWNEKTNTTVSQRLKEGSVDYRYFPEPDLPPLQLTDEWIENVVSTIAELPRELRIEAENLGVNYSRVDELQNVNKLRWVVEAKHENSELDTGILANWAGQEFADYSRFVEFVKFVQMNKLSGHKAGQLFLKHKDNLTNDLVVLAEEMGGVADDDLGAVVQAVLDDNLAEVARYKAGETKLIGVFIGQVMAKSGGGAEPSKVKQIIEELLGG